MKKYTYSAKRADIDRKWWVVDAEGEVLGRLATKVAAHLKGKHKTLPFRESFAGVSCDGRSKKAN